MTSFSAAATIFIVGILGVAIAEVHAQGEIIQNANQVLSQVPGIGGLAKINGTGLPLEAAKQLLKDKCTKNGAASSFESASKSHVDLAQCMQSLVNTTELQAEMAAAAPTGDLDIVFKKYCRKSPTFKRCLNNYTTAIEPCLEEKERMGIAIFHNITESLLKFICFKEGDRIALFIAAEGPECFRSKQAAIQSCANSTYGGYIPAADPNTGLFPHLNTLPTFTFDEKSCGDMVKLQTCTVKELETCKDPTTANLVDSIFNFVKKVTPCHK